MRNAQPPCPPFPSSENSRENTVRDTKRKGEAAAQFTCAMSRASLSASASELESSVAWSARPAAKQVQHNPRWLRNALQLQVQVYVQVQVQVQATEANADHICLGLVESTPKPQLVCSSAAPN